MKVLISRPDKIGDVVLALHGAKQLKLLRPDWEVWMHVSPYTEELVRAVKFLDGVVTTQTPAHELSFDIVVDLMAKFHMARQYFMAPIKVRIGNGARWFSPLFHRRRYVRRSRALLNEAEYNWKLISLVDEPLRHQELRTSLDAGDLEGIPEFDEQSYAVFMPGASVSAEAWPFHNWLELVQRYLDTGTRKVVILLGPAEQRFRERFDALAQDSDRVQIENPASLLHAVGIVRGATHYVGPSTGLTHLASAFGIRGVGLYPAARSMHPDRWAPFQSSLAILSPLRSTSPEDVLQALDADSPREDVHREKISAFVICKNEEDKIARCLTSLAWCDEILVVDSGSTDRTLEIVRRFPQSRVIVRPWPGHRAQKQFALEQCLYPWIVNLDADEELSVDLRNRMLQVLRQGTRFSGFELCRVVYFLERWWDRGGWHPEYRLRFFRRDSASWGGIDPHEKAIVEGPIGRLKGFILHYSFLDISDFVDTQNRFSTLAAHKLHEQGVRSGMVKIIFRPLVRFMKFFVLKGGYREGRAGLIVAGIEALGTFLKYAKLWKLSTGRIVPSSEIAEVSEEASCMEYMESELGTTTLETECLRR